MKIENFLIKFVEGYLFKDLESMVNIELAEVKEFGGAGYPVVSTALSGMELLGNLLTPGTSPFNPNSGNDYFLYFWNSYLSQEYPAYSGLGRLFRQLMRNGISHTFVAKPGIFVEKGTNRQVSVDTIRQEVYVDCKVLFREFEDVYNKKVKPILDGSAASALTTKNDMQSRLDSMSTAYSNDTERLFRSFSPSATVNNVGRRSQVAVSPLFIDTGVRAGGASGPMGPVDFSVSEAAATSIVPPSTTVPFTTPSGTLPPNYVVPHISTDVDEETS